MPGLFDALETILGRPSPVDQIAAGQVPGMPPAGPPGGPGGAPGGGPAGQPPAAAGPPGAAPAQQEPKNLQSPPDLAQQYQALSSPAVYAQMVQRQMAQDNFYRSMGGFISALSPASQRAGIQQQWSGMGAPDAGAMMGNIMRLQQWNQQMRQQQAFEGAIPDLAKAWGMTPDEVRAIGPDAAKMFASTKLPPEIARAYSWFKNDYVTQHQNDPGPDGKPIGPAGAASQFEQDNPPGMIIAGSMPGADPDTLHMQRETLQWRRDNPDDPVPWHDVASWRAYNTSVQQKQEAQNQANSNYPTYKSALTDMRNKAADLVDPKNKADMTAIAGWGPVQKNLIMSSDYGAKGMQDLGFATAHQIELFKNLNALRDYNVSGLQSTNPRQAQDFNTIRENLAPITDFTTGFASQQQRVNDLIGSVDQARANAAVSAGRFDELSTPDLEKRADPSFLPGGSNYLGKAKKMGPSDIAEVNQAIQQAQAQGKNPMTERANIVRHLKVQGYDTRPIERG